MVDLSGTWRAAVAGDAPRDEHHSPDLDDGSWAVATVPGHWRSDPAFAHTDEPVVYRTTFDDPGRFGPGASSDTDPDDADRRTWLVLDGVFYTSDVWLDGAYLGDTEGYFFPHQFEISDTLAGRSQHTLAVEVACPRPSNPRAKRNLTGVFQHWDLLDQDWTPGGIWRPVHLQQSGPVRIRHSRTRCLEVTDQSATVGLRVVLDTRDAATVELVTTITPHLPADELAAQAAPSAGHRRLDGYEHRRTQSIAAGENRVEWTVNVGSPRRWWPWSLGDQPLYDVVVEVRTEAGGVSDRVERRLGLRTVEMTDWVTSINGERLFLKGANQGPTRMALGEATASEMADDVALARDARARLPAPPRPRGAPGAVPGGRRGRDADLAGPPAAVGLRPRGQAPGQATGPGGG